MNEEEIKKILWLSGLKNAVKFNGKPNKKAIMGKLLGKCPELRPLTKTINPLLDEIINQINKLELDEQRIKLLEMDPNALNKEKSEKEIKRLPELPNLKKYEKVIMRLAPYPSGALHIGNARMIVLNDEYVKKHNGELILFFDDTIGSPKSLRDSPKAKYVLPEAYKLIEEGLEWLGVQYSKVYYKSNRLDIYYEYCEKLIKENMAYVCFCSASEFKDKYKSKKLDCPHRNYSTKQNFEEWKKMLSGKYREREVVVRLKTGMTQKDPALRDQILMRISEATHPKVGNDYIVWPMLEFSWAIDDHLINATHILRGADLIKEDFIEDFIWNHFKWDKAEFLHYGRINFKDIKLSKTEARNKIQNGEYDGWEDPRTWSLQSLRKRGIKPEALRETLLDLGMSMSGIKFSVGWLYSKNQEIIDEISNRYFFVENPVKLIIDNVPFEEFIAKPLLLPTKPEKGTRKIKCISKNQQLIIYIAEKDSKKVNSKDIIRLKDLMNIQITALDISQNIIKAEFHSQKLERSYPIIQWVPESNFINISILKPDGTISTGYGEDSLEDIPLNKTIQFERYGFVNPVRKSKDGLFCYFTH